MRGLICAPILALIICGFAAAAEMDIRLSELDDDNNISVILKVPSGEKDEIAAELASQYIVNYVSESIDAISLEVTKKDLAEIGNREDVKAIRKLPDLHMALQDSTEISNFSSTWGIQANGINLTGAGQTICVIDSGINYSHSAFGGCNTTQFLGGNCSKVIGGYAFYNNVTSNRNDPMGDSDHGTHVAGIIAGNGTITGAAPDSKIVAIKACGPTSSCDGLAVIDGINWCTSNSSTFNITVISMSLGTQAPDLFDSYCDANSPEFSSAINAAAAKNISVIVAAGNGGNVTHISLPACMSNATAVGAVDKSDSILYNRGRILSLLAPGASINSTLLNGGFGELSGTSMATPHVAAAFAIIKQFMNQINVSKDFNYITSALNSSGRALSDSTGINYTRINLYDSILLIGNNVTIHSPNDSYSANGTSASIEFNFTVTTQMNASFSSCSIYANSLPIANLSILNQTWPQNISASVSAGNYSWRVGCQGNLSINFSNLIYSEYRTFTITAPEEPEEQQPSTASSSSGGGGGGPTVFTTKQEEIEVGYSKALSRGQAIRFSASNASQKHTLTLNSISDSSANLTMRSNTINLVLSIGESAKFNLSSAEFFDILVKLEGIRLGKANITIQSINERIAPLPRPLNEARSIESWNLTLMENQDDASNAFRKGIIMAAAALLIAAIAFFLLHMGMPKRSRRKHRR